MKTCPMCHQVYPDDAPDFCGQDGTPLVAQSSYSPAPQAEPYLQSPPGGGYAPAAPYAPKSVDGGISQIAMIMGIVAASTLVLDVFLVMAETRSYRTSEGAVKLIAVLNFLLPVVAVTAINTGIVALTMANRHSFSKTKALVGLCLGIAPILIFIILILSQG